MEKLIPAFQTIDDSSGILSTIVDDVFLTLKLIREYEVPQSVLSDLVRYAIKKSTSAGMRGADHSWEFAELAAGLANSEQEQEIKKMIITLKKEGKGMIFLTGIRKNALQTSSCITSSTTKRKRKFVISLIKI